MWRIRPAAVNFGLVSSSSMAKQKLSLGTKGKNRIEQVAHFTDHQPKAKRRRVLNEVPLNTEDQAEDSWFLPTLNYFNLSEQ